MENKSLSDFAEEYIEKGKKKFGRTPTYGEIEEIIAEEKDFKSLSEKIENRTHRLNKLDMEDTKKDIKEFIKRRLFDATMLLGKFNAGNLTSIDLREHRQKIKDDAGDKLITK